MIYPSFLNQGNTIGIAAPSDGNKKETDFLRLDNGKKNLEDKGYQVMETPLVRGSNKGRSGDKKIRAKEFMELIHNLEVKWVVSAKGGDFLVEILPFVDFSQIKVNPKWIQGYSDNTGITYTITTICDMATIYGCNFNDFGMKPWHTALENNLAILEGKELVQSSFDLYEDGFYDRVTGIEGYVLEKPVSWRNLSGGINKTTDKIELTGRLLGGCLDSLLNLAGTRFDKTVSFTKKYEEDGILWYLESFSLTSEALTRGLWQLKEAGWFATAKGFIFGRPAFFEDFSGITYEEAVLSVLGELNVPIILEADIGHKAPQMTMVNGALADIYSENGKGTLRLRFK